MRKVNRRMKVVVYGAGAVGSVLGGLLALHDHDVLLVCRDAHAQAVNANGIRMRSATGDHIAHPRAVTSISAADVPAGACLLLAVKSYDVAASLEAIGGVVPSETPVVAIQNGVESEPLVSELFAKVYGGVCRMTCSMLQPGSVSFRRLGRVVIGRYPKGADAFARSLGAALNETGLDVCVSRTITSDKWLKLAVNTQSVFHAAIDTRDHDTNEFFELKATILEEVARVFKAAHIRARSSDGRDPTIAEMVDDLRRPRARRGGGGMKVHNSTWQNLYLKRDAIENAYFHRPVIKLAGEHNVPVPRNTVALDIATRLHASGAGPESMRLAEVLEAVAAAEAAA